MFGLMRKSTHEEVLDEKVSEVQKEADEQRKQKSIKSSGLNAVLDELPQIPEYTDGVITTEQPYVAYKAVEGGIAVGLIPEGATIVYPMEEPQENNLGPDKYRTDQFVVADITRRNDDESVRESEPLNRVTLHKYTVGETHNPNDFHTMSSELNEDTSKVCTSGIHFFKQFYDAKNWDLLYSNI